MRTAMGYLLAVVLALSFAGCLTLLLTLVAAIGLVVSALGGHR